MKLENKYDYYNFLSKKCFNTNEAFTKKQKEVLLKMLAECLFHGDDIIREVDMSIEERVLEDQKKAREQRNKKIKKELKYITLGFFIGVIVSIVCSHRWR